ncbi:beta-glucosidase 1A [Kockovaella imperatae]|uniref:beta-glucosidase n=1 Tax=Kockovaella imperatae TaxID=4999 RepID=A0A1Y1UFG2_9TREE|nr:beta-glucosidase 1A [Kockovaella imperatae]ORX36246.1 beta-glucosidase 1A [Kockovaella imperatae]
MANTDFLYGFASASYQIEGATKTDGRGPSVWDEALLGKENGDDACDSYHKWRDDIELLKKYGATAYRFSISWSRVIPLGGKEDPVNPEGIKYYSSLIDGLLEAGITPFVTLFHWDTPLELAKRYRSFFAQDADQERFLADWERYADLCFKEFGDRVKHWITHNEPQIFTILNAMFLEREKFDMETDRWIVGENLLLTHARAVHCYRTRYKERQGGVIGITLNIEWIEPIDDSEEAKAAAQHSLDIQVGYYADPIYLGRHNETAKKISHGKIREFTEEEWGMIAHSSDFFGLNHYSTKWATGKPGKENPNAFEVLFGNVEQVTEKDGKPIGFKGHNGHPFTVPWGFNKLLHYISKTWCTVANGGRGGETLPIYVTENGFAEQDEGEKTLEEIVNDTRRQEYYEGYIGAMGEAMKDGVIVKGYMGWSLLDNLEWSNGYAPRFGVTHVDRANGFKRTPKQSAYTIKKLVQKIL